MGADNKYFSVVAMFIMFRETLEAAVIVSILLQCMRRVKPTLVRQVWWGASLGILVSVGFGVVFVIIYYVASDKIFSGNTKYIFKAVMSWIAALLISWLAFAMLRFYGVEEKYSRKLRAVAEETAVAKGEQNSNSDDSGREDVEGNGHVGAAEHTGRIHISPRTVWSNMRTQWQMERTKHMSRSWAVWIGLRDDGTADSKERRTRLSVFLLSFTAVFREGVETVVFLGGVTGGASYSAIPLAAFVGLLMGLAVGAFVYYTGRQMKDLKWFFILSTLLLFFIAAGLVGWGVSDFQTAGVFGRWSIWYQDRDWWNIPLWDIGGCCSDSTNNSNKFFPMMRAIIGYQDRPTALEVILYLGYWMLVMLVGVWKAHAGTLFDADWKHKKKMAKLAKEQAANGPDELDACVANKDTDKASSSSASKDVEMTEDCWRAAEHLADPSKGLKGHSNGYDGLKRNSYEDDFAMAGTPPRMSQEGMV